MKRIVVVTLSTVAVVMGLAVEGQQSTGRPPSGPTSRNKVASPAARKAPSASLPLTSSPQSDAKHDIGLTAEQQTALVKQYCVACHSDRGKAGGLTLASFDAARILDRADVGEKMIRKLRAGMMPPAGAKRPEPATLASLAEALETRIDMAALLNPNPGRRPSARLSRREYARAVKDLLDIDVDVNAFLPADTISDGFDNITDTQIISTTLLQGYLGAASQISRLAVGDRNASPKSKTWKVPRTGSQMRHVEGAPLGTRGGLSVVHVFPADGEYVFKVMLHMDPSGDMYGAPHLGEQLEVSLNGARAVLLDIDPLMNEEGTGLTITSQPIQIPAGPQRVSAAFLARSDGPVDDLIRSVEQVLADSNIGSAYGVTALPHIRDFTITGPMKVTGVSETPSRRRIFTCRPTLPSEEMPCASTIVRRLATEAYRGVLAPPELKELMAFFSAGRKAGDFENGIRFAVQAILASPRFFLRPERAPAAVAGGIYPLSNVELASRLSFFLWGTLPDAELLQVAGSGRLRTPAVYQTQLRRMLAHERAETLGSRFGSQWLRLQDVKTVIPDSQVFPQWDATLSDAMVRETELFFQSLLREDRSVLDLLTADFTFVNERLAKHYRIPNVIGTEFRRVQLPDDERRGILGHGSVLTLTSAPDRTSPVLRGKWVMEVLLGSPPPAAPPDVPPLEDTTAAVGSKVLTVRERMEEHRKNPACTSCHRVMDPLGLALENFDATGAWRIKDSGNPIDSTGDLYDGTKMAGPVGLRNALLKHRDTIILSFTERLMTFALGRRVEFYDMPTVRAIVREAKQNDYRFSSFISGVANSAAFRMSTAVSHETTDSPASSPSRSEGSSLQRR
jgi:hypothetical protein